MHIGTQGTYRGPEKDRHCIEGGQEDEGVWISSSVVQDRVSSYQRGFKNRHRNSEGWKRVGKFGFLSTKIQRHGPGKGFEVLGGHSPPRPLGFMRSVTGTRLAIKC